MLKTLSTDDDDKLFGTYCVRIKGALRSSNICKETKKDCIGID